MKKLSIAVLSVLCAFSLVLGLGGVKKANAETGTASYVSGASITLTDSIAVNYFIENANEFDKAEMTFTFRGRAVTSEADVIDGKAKITFDGLAPQYMTETIGATLTLKGTGVEDVTQNVKDFSVKAYVNQLLSTDKKSGETVKEYEALRSLAVDLLYYGDEAQKYIAEENGETIADSALASNGLTSAQKALKTTFDTSNMESEYVAPENNTDNRFRWVGYGARFDAKLGVYFEFIAKSTQNLKIVFNGETEVTTFESYSKTVGDKQITVYKAVNELFATDYATKITAQAYVDDTLVGSPITYSVKSLVKDFESGTKENSLALASVAYGQSAVKYVGEKSHVCEFVNGAVEDTEDVGSQTINQYTDVPTGVKVNSQKLAKVCKYCGKVSETGETATIVYDIDERVLSKGASIMNSSSANVKFAMSKSQGGYYAHNFSSNSNATMTFNMYSNTAKSVTVVLKAASGYIVTNSGQWGGGNLANADKTAKTADMQLNKVFSASLNGNEYAIADDAILFGNIATGGDNYKVNAHWTYVQFTLELSEGLNTFNLVADKTNDYKDNGGSASSPRIDSFSVYSDDVILVTGNCVSEGDGHYYENLIDGSKVSFSHEFEELIADAFIAEKATCTHGTLYYKSCICGAKSAETFDDGKKTEHNYVSVAENGEHYQKCSVCQEETAHTTEHIYSVTSATEATAGTQTATLKCACGAEQTVISPSVYKDVVIADVVGQNNSFRDQSGTLTRFSPILYKPNSARNGCITQTKTEMGTASATVMTACTNNTTNETFMSYLYGGAGVGYKIYAEKAGTVSVVVKAASGWLLSTGNWKTGDMQFNKVFRFSVNGNEIPVDDSAMLYGNTTGSSVYGEAMANWTYVAITFNVLAGENDIRLISCAPLKEGYEQRADGNIYAIGGTTALTTRAQLSNAMLYFDPGDTGTQSTVQLDSLAFYDLNGAGILAENA